MVHIGDISSSDYKIQAKEVWRVNPDGEIRDTFQKLYNVFEMKEVEFFEYYNKKKKDYSNNELLIAYHQEEKAILSGCQNCRFLIFGLQALQLRNFQLILCCT